MLREGKISSFHNISTNASPISIDGVTVEDLLSIIRYLMDRYGSDEWRILIDDLYKHIVDRNNPHKFTIEQLDQDIIDVIYKQWIAEGYLGSKQDFLNVFFQYVLVADLDDMGLVMEGTSTTHVPVIAVLAEYVRLHDINLKAHEEQFAKILGTREECVPLQWTPAFSMSRLCNIGLQEFYNYQTIDNDVDKYPVVLSNEGLFLLQLYLSNTQDPIDPLIIKPQFMINYRSHDSSKLERYCTISVNRQFIYIEYFKHDGYLTDVEIVRSTTQAYLNVGLRFNVDGTYTLYYDDTSISFGDVDLRPATTEYFLTIHNLLKFPEDLTLTEYLTLGCSYFHGHFNEKQIHHMLASYWPNPS